MEAKSMGTISSVSGFPSTRLEQYTRGSIYYYHKRSHPTIYGFRCASVSVPSEYCLLSFLHPRIPLSRCSAALDPALSLFSIESPFFTLPFNLPIPPHHTACSLLPYTIHYLLSSSENNSYSKLDLRVRGSTSTEED